MITFYNKLLSYLKIIRAKQWLKNLIIFIPFFASANNELFELFELFVVAIGFSFVVSSTYLINDYIDKESDKSHPIKKERVILIEDYTQRTLSLFVFFMFLSGVIIIFIVSIEASLLAFSYAVLSIFYSFKTKYIKYLDLISIALFFILRLYIGGVVTSINISIYTFLYIFFISIGITSSKKYSILKNNKINKSKVKEFLFKNYKENELILITKYSFLVSSIVYIFWSLEKLYISEFNFVIFILALLVYLLFICEFIKDTKINKTEEFIELIFNNKKYILYLNIFVAFNVFIVYSGF